MALLFEEPSCEMIIEIDPAGKQTLSVFEDGWFIYNVTKSDNLYFALL